MKNYTKKELKLKAETYCSSAERCPVEVEEKLKQWGAEAEVAEQILASLFKERYLDTARYCCFFVRDKYRFNQWGRMKIAQALRMKRLPVKDIEVGLEEIDEDEYAGILKKMLHQKMRSIKAKTPYEQSVKLIRFAVGRGFTMDEVLRYVKQVEADGYLD